MKRDPSLPSKVKDRDNNTCLKCGLSPSARDKTIAHHIIPLAYDGPDSVDNMATLCTHCDRFVPESLLERSYFQDVFEDYIGTNVRPEVDLARFGTELDIDGDVLTEIYSSVTDNLRSNKDRYEYKQSEYFWLTLAALAEYGSVSDAVGGTLDVVEIGSWASNNKEIVSELY